jgi:hypothetical protein
LFEEAKDFLVLLEGGGCYICRSSAEIGAHVRVQAELELRKLFVKSPFQSGQPFIDTVGTLFDG